MMFKKYIIIYLIIFILISICFKNNFQKHRQENLTNTDHHHSIDYSKIEEMIDNKISITKEDVTKIVKEQYSIDVETIRNLEEIAKKLQTEESLIIPGNLTVRGKLDVDTDGGNVKFRNLNVSNNTNLKNLKVEEKLESKVFDNYSLKDHNHDDTYSKLNHNHNKEYSKLDHNHDNIYSKLKHNHDNTYSKVVHNHDEYAPVGHIHLEYINPDLTDLATKKWVNDKEYVTKDHTHNNLTMTGKLKVKDLEVTNKGIIDELEITNNQNDGSASWNTHFNFEKGGKNYIRGNEFHIQGKNGGQTNIYGEPIFDKNIKATGNIYSDNWVQAKNLKATGDIYSDNEVQAKNLNITDLATVKRLDIIPGNGIWNSHFNYDNKGINYIRGNDTEIRGSEGGTANLHGNINFKGDVNMGSKLTVKGELNVEGSMNYLPKGTIVAFNGTEAPNGWAICDGKNGTPNLKGRFIYGYSGAGISNKLKGTGGLETVKLTTKQMPEHNHKLTIDSDGKHLHEIKTYNDDYNHKGGEWYHIGWENHDSDAYGTHKYTEVSGSHTHKLTMDNTGSSDSHENMPPYCVLLYIIKL